MVRLDDEERRQAGVSQKPSRLLLDRSGKHRHERRMEIRRQLRNFNGKLADVLSRFKKWRRQRRVSFRRAHRKSAKRRRRQIYVRSTRYEAWRECRRNRSERKDRGARSKLCFEHRQRRLGLSYRSIS